MTTAGFTQPGPFPATIETTLDSPPSSVDRSGPQTTEFWTLIAHYVITIFVSLMAFWHPGYTLPTGAQALVDAVVPGLAVVAAAIAQYGYSRSRAVVKTATAQVQIERQGWMNSVELKHQEFNHQMTLASMQYANVPDQADAAHSHRTPKQS